MSREEIELGFISAGWKITDRSSPHLLVGSAGHLLILAYDSLTRTDDPVFELIDRERVLTYWVRVVPSPRIAEVLIGEHGGPLGEERHNPREG